MSTETGRAELDYPTTSDRPAAYLREGNGLSFLDLLILLARGKRTILAFVLGCAVLAAVISLLLPKRYTATVTLLPPQQSGSMASALASQLGNLGGLAAMAGGSLGIKNPNDTYVAMLKSRTVEDGLIERFHLMQEYHVRYMSDARTQLEREATIDSSTKDNLIHISVENKDPKRAAQLANGYVEQFRDLSSHLAVTEASQRRLFFEQQLAQAKDKLSEAEQQLEVTEQKTGLIMPTGQAAALIQSAVSLRAQIAAKQIEIQSLRMYATDQNPQLETAEKELAGMQAQLAKLGGSQAGGDDGLLLPRGKVSQASLEFLRDERNVKYYETIFEILARQFEAAKLDEAKEGALIQVLDPATPPDRRSFPRRTLFVICGMGVGLFFGIFAVLAGGALEEARKEPETARKLSSLRRAISFSKR